MSTRRGWGIAFLLVACCPWSASQAGVYVRFGGPCYRPYYGYGPGFGFGYYRPYPLYLAPPPVIVQPGPVVVQQPAVVQPAYPPPAQPPAPLPPPTPVPAVTAAPPANPVTPAAATSPPGDNRQIEIESYLQQLRNGDESGRADALVHLGRLKAQRAVGPMIKALNSDGSAKVREAAARGIGLIGDPSSLSALQYAAQSDDDREVRHSASFAAEVIRGNLRRNP